MRHRVVVAIGKALLMVPLERHIQQQCGEQFES
jgi:hypothetical protein